jgi:hypothetical protein
MTYRAKLKLTLWSRLYRIERAQIRRTGGDLDMWLLLRDLCKPLAGTHRNFEGHQLWEQFELTAHLTVL